MNTIKLNTKEMVAKLKTFLNNDNLWNDKGFASDWIEVSVDDFKVSFIDKVGLQDMIRRIDKCSPNLKWGVKDRKPTRPTSKSAAKVYFDDETKKELLKLDKSDWFTNGEYVIKGKPPISLKMKDIDKSFKFDNVQYIIDKPKQQAKIVYYYTTSDYGYGVSRNPITTLQNTSTAVVIADGKEYYFNQAYMNFIHSYYPADNIEYYVNELGYLIIEQKWAFCEKTDRIVAVLGSIDRKGVPSHIEERAKEMGFI